MCNRAVVATGTCHLVHGLFMVCDPVVTWNQLGEIEARWRDWIFSQIDASNVSVSAATSSQTQIGVIESVP